MPLCVLPFMSEREDIYILHVDDNRSFAEMTANFLEQKDDIFTVETATSASEGLEHLSTNEFDCVVSDYDMPGETGIEFLESVREKAPALPFVLFTGKGSEEIAGRAISAGVTDYLQKETGTDQYTVLANRLQNAVQRYRAENDRKRQRKAIETAQEGISILTEDGEYIYVNQAYADIYGYNPDEMTGKDWKLTCPDSQISVAQNNIISTVNEDGYWSGETTGLRADGTTFPEEHTVSQTDTGELVCSVRDKSVAQEREFELTQFRTLVRTLSDPVYVLDDEGQFEYVNAAFVDLVGYDRETLIGSSMALIKSSEAIDRSETHLGRVLSSNGPDNVQFEIEVQPKQGEPIICEDHMGVLPYNGKSFEGSVGILRDITEQKERETMLRRYQYVYESALSGIAITDLDGKLIDVNPAFLDMWGYDNEDDVIGRPATDMWDDPEQAMSVLETITEQGRREDELKAVRADGSTFYARGVNSHLTDNDGNPIGVIGFFFDITDRKEREQEIKQTSSVLRTIVENLPMGVLVEDTERNVLMTNDQLGETLGVPIDSEELIGRNCAAMAEDINDLFADPEGFIQGITDRLEQRKLIQNEELPLADGRVLARDYVPYTLPEGEAHLWLYRDITARKQQQHALERSNRFLEQTQNVAGVGGWEMDLCTESLRWTDEVYRIHGLDMDLEPTVKDAIEHYHPEDQATIEDVLEQLTTKGEPYDLELRIVTTDDEVRWVHTRGKPLYEDGEIIGARGTFQDITEQMKREQRLEEFASVVSHDIRNPLNVATGRLALAAEECDSTHLDDVKKALTRIETLVDDLLTLTRNNQEVTDPHVVDLAAVAAECWETVETPQATLENNIDQRVFADKSRIKQVFENLFRNAVEHGGADVTVTIGELDDGFYIEDNGQGIPADEHDNIFENGYSRATDGTGFGLSIVEQVVNAHDWQIRMTDGAAGGARFEITNVE